LTAANLIYKSNIEAIQAHEAKRDLTRYVSVGLKPSKRKLFLTKTAMRDFDNPNSATNLLCGRGNIQAAFTLWTRGDLIWAMNGKGMFLKRLDPPPPEIWEIRVMEPTTQVRIFCRFAEPDTLVVTNIHTRGHLGKKGSANWKDAMAQCEKQWNSLFEDLRPFAAASVGNYVTENCHDFKI
jgi:hypothetical protein